jgi:cystathionine beta-synthase
LVSHTIERMKSFKIAQSPVNSLQGFVVSVDESILLPNFITDKNIAEKPIQDIMGKPYPVVKITAKLEDISNLINNEN